MLKEHLAQYVFQAEFGAEQLVPVRRQELWRDVLRCFRAPGFVQDRGVSLVKKLWMQVDLCGKSSPIQLTATDA